MVHALMLALMCAAAASATSYIDYSGVKMPQYGGGSEYDMGRDPPPSHPSDDYHGHSPDAPASLDYKYEEKPRGKTDKPPKESEDLDMWRKNGRKQRELVRPAKIDTNMRHKYHDDDDEVPNFMSNRRYSKHRSRLKNENEQTEEESPLRRHNKYSGDRKDDISGIDRKEYLHLDKEYVPEDKNKEFEEDVKFVREVSTKRPNRRRPRDRQSKKRILDEDYSEDNWPESPVKTERLISKDMPERDEIRALPRIPEQRIAPTRERDRAPDREHDREPDRETDRETDRGIPRYRPVVEEEEDPNREEPVKVVTGKFKAKSYDEYDDYYDMKRVQSIKKKLPMLLMRRTTVREQIPTRVRSRMKIQTFTEPRETLTSTLRALEPTVTSTLQSTETETETENIQPTTISPTTVTSVILTIMSSQVFIPTLPSSSTSTTRTIVLDTTQINTGDLESKWADEKTRLMILKKVQRKEGLNFLPTKKPPVLMQVTKYMPTVVMVEPPSSHFPMRRSDEDDNQETAEQLVKIKRLMRRKLVANAKSIHDLTDNWDEMVCDYVDTSQLSSANPVTPTMCAFCLPVFVFVVKTIADKTN